MLSAFLYVILIFSQIVALHILSPLYSRMFMRGSATLGVRLFETPFLLFTSVFFFYPRLPEVPAADYSAAGTTAGFVRVFIH
jgi:hypothetical protein